MNRPYRRALSSRVRRNAAMRTTVETHELLPEGLYLESLGIEGGRVRISGASGSSRSRCPLCTRGSSRVHSRYSRTVQDLPCHGISVELRVREALLLRRALLREEDIL
jgi:zinc-finger of transposase IS204/IS1001/IS1096/IS1165